MFTMTLHLIIVQFSDGSKHCQTDLFADFIQLNAIPLHTCYSVRRCFFVLSSSKALEHYSLHSTDHKHCTNIDLCSDLSSRMELFPFCNVHKIYPCACLTYPIFLLSYSFARYESIRFLPQNDYVRDACHHPRGMIEHLMISVAM